MKTRDRRKEGNVLFHYALNIFYLRLYGVIHMVKGWNPLPPLSNYQQGFFYMHHPTDRITHTTASVTPVVEHWLGREIAQWRIDPMTHRTMSESSYHGTSGHVLLKKMYICCCHRSVCTASFNVQFMEEFYPFVMAFSLLLRLTFQFSEQKLFLVYILCHPPMVYHNVVIYQ